MLTGAYRNGASGTSRESDSSRVRDGKKLAPTIEQTLVEFPLPRMNTENTRIMVTYELGETGRALLTEMLGHLASLTFLRDVPEADRESKLSASEVLLSWHPSKELRPDEWDVIGRVRLIQLISAGADHVPFANLPPEATLASNAGAYAEPMAEHVLAMALSLAKRLVVEHENLSRGEFNQAIPNQALGGGTCGILGFGGIGQATARLMRAMGMKVFALNRSGRTQEPIDFIGTLDDLGHVLRVSDLVVVALPLTAATRGLIGSRELGWMKPDAILINVARGAIIDEEALYEHLKSHQDFRAGIDAWWVEPFVHEEFRTGYPFLELPNVLGSPHNFAIVPGMMTEALRRAGENVRRYLSGSPLTGIIRPEDR
jgi:phosphoglycerate dehydrogenase-like enzyme